MATFLGGVRVNMPPDLVNLGDNLELDRRAYEVRRSGQALKLSRIPMELLLLLVERHGQLVTRDEIVERVWGKDVFLDADNSINAAIRKLRQVLGDDPQEPRFVQTVTGMGYRFIAPVEEVIAPDAGPAAPTVFREQGVSVPQGTNLAAPQPPRRAGQLWRVPILVVVLAMISAGVYYYRSLKANRLTDKDTIVLTDFANTTGDVLFDDTLKQGLSVQLEQSPFLDLISDRRVDDTLKLMGHAGGERLTPDLTREVCVRTGSKAMLAGSIAALGKQYVIGLKAVNCDTGDVLAEAQEQAAGKEVVLKALDAAAVRMRSRLGESHSSVQTHVTPLMEATTPSLEALKAYSLGVKTQATQGDTAALPLFKRAAELDPNFALAYSSLTSVYANLNELKLAAECARKAYELREKVSERERFPIEIDYYMVVTGELEKAAQACEQWQRTYSRDYEPYANLSYIFASLGNHEKALEEVRDLVRLEPNDVISYSNLGGAYANLNQLNEAEGVVNQAKARQLESEGLLLNRYELAFLKNDTVQMTRVAAVAMGNAGAEDLLLATQADTEAWHGKLKNARELTQGAIESAERNDAKETAASYQAAAALREVESGNRKQARRDVEAAMKLAPNRNVRIFTALVLARVGDRAAAEKIADDLDKTFPLDTLVQRYWLPSIRATVALQTKDSKRALELLKMTSAVEFSQSTQVGVILCPVYLRGEVYLLLRDGNAAAAEFQKFLDHRGLVGNFPWGALARLGLARAYVLQGDTARARTAYQDFLTLWKDADPDITILKQAKAEYAKLH
jgi:DNA-binding winged helix-turn-helix (wHTH) protein/tetratricopeptide (TPR) repeat protein